MTKCETNPRLQEIPEMSTQSWKTQAGEQEQEKTAHETSRLLPISFHPFGDEWTKPLNASVLVIAVYQSW